jgi:aconitate hydratase/homoaconitate hydratase
MTLTEKILCHHATGLARPWVQAGDMIRIRADWTMASELAWNGMNATYEKLGRPPIHDRERFYLAIDHTVDPGTLARDARTQKLVALSRGFAREAALPHFHDANVTIMHTKFYRDLVQPGETVIGADSHTSSHGGLGAFAIGLGGADVCVAMVLGETWIQVPEAIQVVYDGRLPFGLTGKDVILKTLGELGRNTVALERSVEYVGAALETFSTDFRFTVANMTAEFGGLNGIFPADHHAAELLARRADHHADALYFRADEEARYVARHVFDLSTLEPQVAKPFSPDNVAGVTACVGQPLDGVFIGACTTTEEELVLGALVLREALASRQPVVPSTNRLVVPGSLQITESLRRHGLLAVYEEAGFRVGPPGCSMCLGIASDKAGPGERWLSSQNRNFENRMGPGSIAWLASAPTVAASAFTLTITDPRSLVARVAAHAFAAALPPPVTAAPIVIREPRPELASDAAPAARGERPGGTEAVPDPSVIEGRAQLFGDHVDTDAIIPGEFCHLTDPDALGRAAFHYVRPDFGDRVARGETILVAGEGWGSGSSREHAAWALKFAGVRAVVARSFAFIHKRNLVNEAIPFFVVSDPAFYEAVSDGSSLTIHSDTGTLMVDGRDFRADQLSPMTARIQAVGGIVPALQRYREETFDVLAGARGR